MSFARSSIRVAAWEIGWMPHPFYDHHEKMNHLLFCYRNRDLVGFLIWDPKDDELRIFQIWVRPDARMIVHGRSLVTSLEQLCQRKKANRITLWCAVDLAANMFWEAIGFTNIGWRWGRAKKSRRHYRWIRNVPRSPLQTVASDSGHLLLPEAPNLPLFLPSTKVEVHTGTLSRSRA